MATDRTEANRAMLAEAADTQEKSKEAIRRIKKQAVETEALAGLTLNELQTQGKQMVFPQLKLCDVTLSYLYSSLIHHNLLLIG